jgi:2-methylcitrate dehydratase PrpD
VVQAAPSTETGTPLTMELAEWISTTRITDIPADVQHQVRRSLIDYFSAAVVGSQTESAEIVREYLGATDHDTSSTVFGTGQRLCPANAAFANGTAAHALDIDDGFTPGGFHPSGPVVSAALALAEARGSSAEDLVRAIALGYEIVCRMALASHPHQRNRGFHQTAIVGVFGAATATAVLEGLDPSPIANAFGLAGSHAGGLLAFLDQGSDVKRLHAGKAGRDGMVSAQLAGRGFTGPTTVLEAPHGYFHAFTGDQQKVDRLLGGLGSTWHMLRTYNKPYPCCRHVHGAIDAVLDMRAAHGIRPEEIDSVRVETFAIAASHDSKEISNLLDAQMSLPYSVGAALVHGEVGMEQFGDTARSDETLVRLIDRFDVVTDAEFTESYPKDRAARVTIRSQGQEFTSVVRQPYGEPDNPMSDQDLEAKLRRLTSPILGTERCEELIAATWDLRDPRHLFAVLSTV